MMINGNFVTRLIGIHEAMLRQIQIEHVLWNTAPAAHSFTELQAKYIRIRSPNDILKLTAQKGLEIAAKPNRFITNFFIAYICCVSVELLPRYVL